MIILMSVIVQCPYHYRLWMEMKWDDSMKSIYTRFFSWKRFIRFFWFSIFFYHGWELYFSFYPHLSSELSWKKKVHGIIIILYLPLWFKSLSNNTTQFICLQQFKMLGVHDLGKFHVIGVKIHSPEENEDEREIVSWTFLWNILNNMFVLYLFKLKSSWESIF